MSGVEGDQRAVGEVSVCRRQGTLAAAHAIKSGGGAAGTMLPLASRCYHGDCRNLGHKQHCVADVSLMEGLVLGLWLLFPGTRQGCYDMPLPKIDEKSGWLVVHPAQCVHSERRSGLSTSSASHCWDV